MYLNVNVMSFIRYYTYGYTKFYLLQKIILHLRSYNILKVCIKERVKCIKELLYILTQP